MQPFDALTMRAILAEATPVLLNRRVDKVQQISRDEIVISLRSKAGTIHLLVSAQASFGRICLVQSPPTPRSANPPPFCQLLRRLFSAATLTGLQQLPGERICDLTFACLDELGNRFTRTLTAEIMGRHSNLIFWDNDSMKILACSHNVTQEMSRQREVAAGLTYSRPPRQEKSAIFSISQAEFKQFFQELLKTAPPAGSTTQEEAATYEQWLMANFAGLGRHLAEEIVRAGNLPAVITPESINETSCLSLWQRIETIQKINEYRPAMRCDLTGFSVLSWWRENTGCDESLWQTFPTTNDLVDAYFRGVQLKTEMQQLKDRIRTELKSEQNRLQARLAAAEKLLETARDHDRFRKFGDLILVHSKEFFSGQDLLDCADLYSDNGNTIKIELNPNLSASQNAQHYYRLYAKSRIRAKAAESSAQDACQRLAVTASCLETLERVDNMADLQVLKERILDRGKKAEVARPASGNNQHRSAERPGAQRLMSTRSSDGFIIIVGRNKQENDILTGRLMQAQDIWLHAQGLEGAHVLIKLPDKKDPPLTTLKEAAQIAARFARAGLGGRVKVAYTYGKHVRKLGRDKPGLVRYENEKVLEVDTASPMPASVRRLFP